MWPLRLFRPRPGPRPTRGDGACATLGHVAVWPDFHTCASCGADMP